MPKRYTDPNDLPNKPGVYIMRDIKDEVLYVGKAKSLIKRVKSYFSKSEQPIKTKLLMSQIHDFEASITDNEKEALILESNLIKRYKPKYNIRLKDDKRYPYIKITNEKFPRVFTTRNVRDDGAYYYGPFTDSGSVKRLVKSLKELFKIRECKRMDGPCLYHQIHLCSAPCSGKITEKSYNEIVGNINLFFQGEYTKIIQMLNEKMVEAAGNHEFEKAAVLRDQIQSIDNILEKQKMELGQNIEQDIIACSYDEKVASVVIFTMREGKIIGMDDFLMSGTEGTLPGDILSAFLKQFYMSPRHVPAEIIIQYKPDDNELIQEWLSENRGDEVMLRTPGNASETRLVQMVAKNAEIIKNHEKEVRGALVDLKKYLNIPRVPRLIEAFDISNISGKHSVGSMVVFEDGIPKKSKYRRYKIKIDGPDDYAMMRDVLTRRYSKISSDERSKRPDLILVDGGKGQLNIALDVLNSLKLNDIPVIGLAKEFEYIFIPDVSSPVILPSNSEALYLLQRIRDEAHRFAVKYHKTLRSKEIKRSILDDIKGIGKKRKIRLLKRFGDIERMKKADIDEIANVEGINRDLAVQIHDHLHK